MARGAACSGSGVAQARDADWLKALVGADCASKADRDTNFHRFMKKPKSKNFTKKNFMAEYLAKEENSIKFH